MENLVPIGRFARVCRLSVKALRHYDEIGLLHPAAVDASSGYRYYALSQANRAEAIRLLRAVDMPLEEIRRALASDDPEVVRDVLSAHRARIEERLAEGRRILAFLERLMSRREGVMPYEVTVKEVPVQRVLSLHTRTSLSHIGEVIGGTFATMFGYLGRAGIAPVGPPLIVYHDEIDEETEGDIELCVPVAAAADGEGEIRASELAAGAVATTVHRGPYNEIGPAYQTLAGWVQEHGHEFAGPPREIYLSDPSTTAPADLLTEIDWPIRS